LPKQHTYRQLIGLFHSRAYVGKNAQSFYLQRQAEYMDYPALISESLPIS